MRGVGYERCGVCEVWGMRGVGKCFVSVLNVPPGLSWARALGEEARKGGRASLHSCCHACVFDAAVS